MAKLLPSKGETEDFGQATGSPLVSPMSYQNTFEGSVDSLHDIKPKPDSYKPPMDPLKLTREHK